MFFGALSYIAAIAGMIFCVHFGHPWAAFGLFVFMCTLEVREKAKKDKEP